MITEVDLNELQPGWGVFVMSKKDKFLAQGIVKRIDKDCRDVLIEITSFDIAGIDVVSCIDTETPINEPYLRIGFSRWFPIDQVFWIEDDDK